MANLHDLYRYATPPGLAQIEAAAREAFAGIPTELRRFAGNVAIRVQDFPDDEVLEEMECETPFDLLGLYQGVDLTRKSISDTPEDVDLIFLYRRPDPGLLVRDGGEPHRRGPSRADPRDRSPFRPLRRGHGPDRAADLIAQQSSNGV